MKNFMMTISKKENGEFKEVGKINVFYPLLSELGISIEPEKFDEEGFPIYADDKVQYVFDATLASVKAQARNKLVSGTANLRDGLSIAETVEALLESGSGNKGEALQNRRDCIAAFGKYVATLGKSEAFVKSAIALASNTEGLRQAESNKRSKMREMLTDFAGTLNAESVAKYERTLKNLDEACNGADAEGW